MYFLRKKQQGQGLVDYALVIALIVLVAMIAARALGENSSIVWRNGNIRMGARSGFW